ncbi:hypothetical protein IMSAGC013_00154 [Lachnospiraceae bacterium]|nr:hypothetical protein [Lachnospiraceae bacterium]GFI28777.1 hypothetical protein IMSAGC013_00154 [Lachnospiraceae bacterium]
MQRKSENKRNACEGSITLFLALTLTIILSLIFSLLEAARVQALVRIARRDLQLRLESAFGRYHVPMWDNYHMLFLDGKDAKGQFNLSVLEGILMEEAALEQMERGFYQISLKNIEIEKYALATDQKGKFFREQACRAIKEKLAAQTADRIKGILKQGEALEKDSHKAEEKWKQAQEAAEKAKEAAEAAKKDGEGEAAKTARKAEKKLPENPMDFVSLWKKSPILTLVVENSFQISPKSISQKNSIQNRKLETGNLEKAGKETLEKLWLIQYLNTYFSCQSGAGAGGGDSHALDYELEYCIGGKETDSQNLEQAVNRLLLLREAGNFATIMQDSGKQALAMEMAAAAVGFTGLPPLIQAVQVGILLGWSYMESILDVRHLLAGGKVPLIKEVSQWQSDVSLGQKALEQDTKQEEQGLDYREYLQILLLSVKEDTLVYRAMDVMEQNIRLLPGEETFAMDHMIQGVEAETVSGADSMFLGLITSGREQDGMYHFNSEYQIFYE